MRRLLLLPLALLLGTAPVRAQLPLHPPEIRTLFPLGGNRGATVEVRVAGVNIGDATGIAVSGTGVSAEVLSPDGRPLAAGAPPAVRLVNDTEARVRFHVAEDAPLGSREFRLYTPVGLSCRALFGVGPAGPDTLEQEPNDAAAQPVAVPGAVEGVISGGEDVDRYRLQVKEGERLTCYIEARSLESKLDSLLTLQGPGGAVLATNEDFRTEDSALAFTAPAAGGSREFQVATPGGLTNPFTLRVLDVPDVREREPNDEAAQAARMPVPGLVHGRVFGSVSSPGGDTDCWKFAAKKREKLRLAVTAMRAGSLLDATLTLRDAKGTRLAANDDADGSRDPSLEFEAPADGEYTAQITDAARRGGVEDVYMLRIEPVKSPAPDFSLAIYPLNPSVPRGGSVPVEVRVTRTGGFAGPIQFELPPVPPGVTALIPPEAAAKERFYVALTAAPDVPYSMGPFWVKEAAPVAGQPVTREATGKERVWKNAPMRPLASSLPGIAVCEPMDFTVALDRQELELRPGEEKEVTVLIRKIRAYPRGIPVRAATVDYQSGALPAGLSVGRVTLPAEAGEVKVSVSAAKETKPGEYTVFVCGLSNPTTNDYILIAQLAPPLKVKVRQ